MPNENNLIRPAVLRNIPQNLANPPLQEPQLSTPQNPVLSPELQAGINIMIRNALETQGLSMINSLLNPNLNSANNIDEIIEERYRGNLQDIDRIPDVVRYLKEFSGNPMEFSSWKKSVDRVLEIYSAERGTPRYFGIVSVIRNKIVGNADVVLESYNTPLNWEAISKCLTLHYADKRDIRTLEYQLMSLMQDNNTIEDFYQKVYAHLSLILNKISSMEVDNTAISLLTQTYREKALDTFIRGLKGDLPRLLAIREPENLPQALHLCQKLANQNVRNVHTDNNFKQNFRQPPLPPRNYFKNLSPQYPHQQLTPRYQQQPQPLTSNYQQQHQFYPQIAYLPQAPRQQLPYNNNFQRFLPQQFVTPNLPNQVEPMDVDPSIHTQRINYMNRPQQQIQHNKRPASNHQLKTQKIS